MSRQSKRTTLMDDKQSFTLKLVVFITWVIIVAVKSHQFYAFLHHSFLNIYPKFN